MEKFVAGVFRELYKTSLMTEYDPFSVAMTLFLAALNIFLSITAFLGNILILIALRKVASLHPPTKLLFRCLAATDLFVGLISEPLSTLVYWPYIMRTGVSPGYFLVGVVGSSLGFVFCMLSMFVSAAISVDRLLALKLGLRYRHTVAVPRVRAVIACFLLIGIATGLSFIFSGVFLCSILALTVAVVSVVITIFCYVKIYLKLRQHQIQVHTNAHPGQSNGGVTTALNLARFKRTVSGIACVQLALAVCYLPSVLLLITYFKFGSFGEYTYIIAYFTVTLVYLNSSLNPVLYCWKISDVRQAVKNTIKQCCCLSA